MLAINISLNDIHNSNISDRKLGKDAMVTLDTLTTFLGWCAILNIGVMLISTLAVTAFKQPVIRLHSRMFGLAPEELPVMYFNYLGNYKIAIYMLNFVPYFALKIMI